MKKDELAKAWDNFKTHFTECYFELYKDNELNKKHFGFVADDTTDHPHMEEAHMANALEKPANAVTSDATKLTNLTTTKSKLAEQSAWVFLD